MVVVARWWWLPGHSCSLAERQSRWPNNSCHIFLHAAACSFSLGSAWLKEQLSGLARSGCGCSPSLKEVYRRGDLECLSEDSVGRAMLLPPNASFPASVLGCLNFVIEKEGMGQQHCACTNMCK